MNILYVRNVDTPWTRDELAILNEYFKVKDVMIGSKLDIFKSLNPISIIKSDVIYIWFASLSFFPLILFSHFLNKKIVVITGGFDVASEPEIGYGAYATPTFSNFFRNKIFKWANKISCFSYSAQSEASTNAKIPSSKLDVTYLGFKDIDNVLKPWGKRKNQIVTIGGITRETYLRKGHKYFIELARQMPQWDFILIGRLQEGIENLLKVEKVKNLKITGFISDEQRDQILNNSKFYLQLSRHEGFGASVVDGALMGCYPIVHNVKSLPEVVKGCGSVVEIEDYTSIKDVIEQEGAKDRSVEELRAHYNSRFPLKVRKAKIKELIQSL